MQKLKNKIYTLLKKSEKWTKTDMVYLAKGGFWLSGNKTVNSITAFCLAIAYANLLPLETYATYKYILSIVALLGITGLAGLDTALSRAVALGKEGLLFDVIKTKLKWRTWGLAAGFTISAYYFFNNNNTLSIAFLIASLFSFIKSGILYIPYLQGKKKFKTISIYSSIETILITLTLIGTLLITNKILIYIFVYYFSHFLTNLIIFIIVFKKNKLNKKTDDTTILLGKHLSLINVLGIISEQIDKILLWHLLGPMQLAIYTFAIIPVKQIQSLLKPIYTLAFPKISNQKFEILKKTMPPKIIKFSLLLLIPIVLFIILVPYLYKIFFPQYLESIKYAKIFAFSLTLYPFGLIGNIFVAHNMKKKLYIIKTATPLIKIILLITLIPIFKISGAIAALLISAIFNVILAYNFLKTTKTQNV